MDTYLLIYYPTTAFTAWTAAKMKIYCLHKHTSEFFTKNIKITALKKETYKQLQRYLFSIYIKYGSMSYLFS